MNRTILNREFQHPADGWYQIEAKGRHPNRAAGVVQVIDDAAAESIVNRFNTDAEAGTLRHGHEMLIDHEHFKDDPSQETVAYGWLTQLANRDDGIYGRIRWTATGKPAVDGGDYRFFSTEYEPADLKVLNTGTPKEVRPLRLDGLTLTNMNNNLGQKPITNRAGTGVPAANQKQQNQGNNMKHIATRLGLTAEASEDAILAELTKYANRGDITSAALTELRNRAQTLETENATLLAEQVDVIMDAHGVKDEKIRNRLKPVLAGLKNRADRVATLEDFGFKPADALAAATQPGTGQRKLLNRETTPPSSKGTAPATDADQAALARQAEAEIQEYRLRNRCSYGDARSAVRRNKPELFGVATN